MGVGGSESLNAFGFFFALLMGALLVFLPRRMALLPIVITVCYMTIGQQVVIAGLHFSIIRIMVFIGWARLIVRGELISLPFNDIDKTIIGWQATRLIMHTIQIGSVSAFISMGGYAYDAVGMYYLVRFLVRDIDEVPQIIKMISIVIVPLAILMLIEKSTTRNIFSIFGGVGENTMVDAGERLRCQGPFRHPILAGTFGATLLPLFIGLYFEPRFRSAAISGVIAAITIVVTAHSSGPVMATVFTVSGMILWRFRESMRVVRWGIVFAMIVLHLVMKDPVWALFGRLSELIGGTGYHRTMLISATISHFDEWWLMGTNYTGHWLPYTLRLDSTMADITNQFIYEGVIGGLLTMLLFIVLISICFRAVGRLVQYSEESSPFTIRIMVWSLGAALLGHVVSFMSVSYFDQNVVIFYFLLACIALCSEKINFMSEQE
jgi:hypothetical protein